MDVGKLRLFAIAALALLAGCGEQGKGNEESTAGDDAGAGDVGTAQQAVNGFYIQGPIVGAGSGCPTPLAYSITPDGQTFTIYFSYMMLQHPPGPTFQRVNCTVGVGMHLPHGQQFSVSTVNTRGFAHLPIGVYADQRSKYFFAGQNPEIRAHDRLWGFFDDDWTFTDELGVFSSVKSPCGGDAILNIDTALILNTAANPYQDAYVDNTTIDGTFRMIFQANWDACGG